MSCVSVRHYPIDASGIKTCAESLDGIVARGIPFGGISASAQPAVEEIKVVAIPLSGRGIRVRMWQECRASLGPKYLEIDPPVVWVLNGWTSNDVYSNTTWYVD